MPFEVRSGCKSRVWKQRGLRRPILKARLPFFLPELSGAVEACGMGWSAFSCPKCAAVSLAVSPEHHTKFSAANMGRSGLWD